MKKKKRTGIDFENSPTYFSSFFGGGGGPLVVMVLG